MLMRLGILGGTFNPIHQGHLVLAETAREQCGLEQVWFVPTASPPHKTARALVDGRHRLAMVRLAVRGHRAFRARGLEVKRGGVSYTIDTIKLIQARDPRVRLFLIVGSDMLAVTWYQMQELQRRCTFVAADRPSSASPRVLGLRVQRLAMPQMSLSSSMIRARVRAGRSIRYLVPQAVADYIARHRLYRRRR